MKKIKFKSLITLSSISIIGSLPMLFISCGSANKNDENDDPQTKPPSNDFESKVQSLINEQKIKVLPKNPTISKAIFDKYKNDLKKIQKSFEVNIDSSLEGYIGQIQNIIKINGYKIDFNVLIKQNENSTIVKINLDAEGIFSDDSTYFKGVSEYIRKNIYLKDEYKDKKIIDIFSQLKPNENFANLIDTSVFSELLGIKEIKFILPSQTTSLDKGIKINFIMYYDNEENSEIKVPTSQPFLNTNIEDRDIFTIINQKDLSNVTIESIDSNYLGKVFFLKNSDEKLTINFSFASKNIINELDFSMFNEIEFGETTSFDNNKITKLIFNPNAKIQNLKYLLFTNNKFKEVNLPKFVVNYNVGAFDKNVVVNGIENIDIVQKFYDKTQNELHLEKASSKDEIIALVDIIEKYQQKRILTTIDKIILPSIEGNNTKLKSLQCKVIEFYGESNTKPINFSWNISDWKISSPIQIPNFILTISKDQLPRNSVQITREINQLLLDKIVNGSLTIETIETDLDKYFYTFDTQNDLGVNKLIFNINNLSLSFNLNSYKLDFFTKNKTINNKEIEISSSISRIDVYNFNSFKKNNNDIRLKRIAPPILIDSYDVTTKKIILEKLNNVNVSNLNEYIVGLEIEEIDTSNTTIIKQNTFKDIEFSKKITINLSKFNEIQNYAFYNTKNVLFSGITGIIGDYAFYNNQIQGDLDLSNVTSLGSSAFSNNKITSVTLSDSLNEIKSSTFSNNQLTTIDLKNVSKIGSSAFSNNQLTSLNLTKVNSIESNAFYNNQIQGDLDLSHATSLGSSAFSNNKITSVTLSDSLNEIKSSTFSNNQLTTIDLKNVSKIGSSAFSNNQLTSLNLIKVNSIDSGAFFGNSSLNNVSNWNRKDSVEKIFSNYKNINFNFDNIEADNNYDASTKILDLSKKEVNFETLNNLTFLIDKLKKNNSILEFNEIILPEKMREFTSDYKKLFSNGVIIKKLTWNSNIKTISNHAFSNLRIETLEESFFRNTNVIGENAFLNCRINMKSISLNGIETIKIGAFKGNQISEFIELNVVREIQETAFESNVSMTIPPNVKLHENAFGINKLPPTVKRPKIFNDSSYETIYSQHTKILDFTKMPYDHPWKGIEEKYKNISHYLLSGDVKKIILPRRYFIAINWIDNLGEVEEIEFHSYNQQILANAFKGTIIKNVPKQSDTNILYNEDDNFQFKQ